MDTSSEQGRLEESSKEYIGLPSTGEKGTEGLEEELLPSQEKTSYTERHESEDREDDECPEWHQPSD